ncbi:MAG: zinc ribbon domain-containing protein [Acidobacteria bacterium]|nr:zinc ribbon domain-containing protein [Acidobacteriota bacterium]
MLTYEYECEGCGKVVEQRRSITADPLSECPHCGGRVRQLVTGGAGFVIKGSGAAAPRGPEGGGCALEREGLTCCGRDGRCGKPPCGGEP